MDFVRDGLNAEEKNILDWADSRLFSNPAFLASKWGPDNWPSDCEDGVGPGHSSVDAGDRH